MTVHVLATYCHLIFLEMETLKMVVLLLNDTQYTRGQKSGTQNAKQKKDSTQGGGVLPSCHEEEDIVHVSSYTQ